MQKSNETIGALSSTEMVERVRKAISNNIGEPLSEHDFYDAARAAIEAMREPTEDLAKIMNRHASNGMVNWRDYHVAMIDTALGK